MKDLQTGILYSASIFFKFDVDKQNPKFSNRKAALQEIIRNCNFKITNYKIIKMLKQFAKEKSKLKTKIMKGKESSLVKENIE